MPNSIEQKINRVTRPPLNDINDAVPGGQQAVSGANIYAAQIGARMWLDGNPGGVRYDTAVATLYGGKYQYVQFFNGTVSPAVGQPTVWAFDQASTAFEAYIVSGDLAAANLGRFAGVALNAVTKGNWGWIQVTGKASVLFGTITAATPADGDMVVLSSSTTKADIPTQSTSLTYALLKAVIGTSIGAATANQTNLVLLRQLNEVT